MTPGVETTEYKIAKLLAIAGTVLPSFTFLFMHWFPGFETAGIVVSISGALLGAAGVLGYQQSRTAVKLADINAQAQIAQSAIVAGVVPPMAQPVANAAIDTLESLIAKKL